MEAKQARQIAEDTRRSNMSEIYKDIEKAAWNGQLSLDVLFWSMTEACVQQLKADGYEVHQDEYSDTITIGW